ncbi:hypothetical protein OTUT144_2090 [Orientia tsutsugamushi str. UT144]|uniref:Uncharacterized protein n=1 Tax=Orientia tsutsugamushi str. UT144 TaxID=1441384 RepID=A0A0F3RL37_ORITS|nr:hypothetical protein [Orientia tsutsugamushi]KJW05874.1 hypothetical protein OTUT144_2090 [Orientia tsutsugamushi str. UT144]
MQEDDNLISSDLVEEIELVMDVISQDLIESCSSTAAGINPNITIDEEEYIDSIIPDLDQQSSNVILHDPDEHDYQKAYEEAIKLRLHHSYVSIYAAMVAKCIAHGASETSAQSYALNYIKGYRWSIENHNKGDCYAQNWLKLMLIL